MSYGCFCLFWVVASVGSAQWFPPQTGTAGPCLFMSSMGLEQCVYYIQSAWNRRKANSETETWNAQQSKLCLGLPDSDTSETATKLYVSYVQEGGKDTNMRFTPKVQIMNFGASREYLQFIYNPGSSFANITSIQNTGTFDVRTAFWFNLAPTQRSNVVVLIANKTQFTQELTLTTQDCKTQWPSRSCIPNDWFRDLIDHPVLLERQVWCTSIGQSDASYCAFSASDTDPCNVAAKGFLKHPCPTSGLPSGEDEWYCKQPNRCTRSGLCHCNPFLVGSRCNQKLPAEFMDLLNSTILATPWLRWNLATQQEEKPNVDPKYPKQGNWSFWTCNRFDPCSGAGQCIDSAGSGSGLRPPRCQCYPGFFGSSILDLEAYAHTFFADTLTTTSLSWNDNGELSPVFNPLGKTEPQKWIWRGGYRPITRYMMLRQCLMWRGPDASKNWIRNTKPRPIAPFQCMTGFAGVNCDPCPPCVHGACVVSNQSDSAHQNVNVCACDDNWTGIVCHVQKCPIDPDSKSPCGVLGTSTSQVKGKCMLRVNSTYREGIDQIVQQRSPFMCDCNNGFTGPSCSIRQCAVPKGTPDVNATLVCSGSVQTPYGPQPAPPHGLCVVVNATQNPNRTACVCSTGYSGTFCQYRECPRVNGASGWVCNNVTRSDGRSVCVQTGAYRDNPYCACDQSDAFAIPLNSPREKALSAAVFNKWYGPACEFSYHASPGPCRYGNETAWCSHAGEGHRMCFPPPGSPRNSRPQCHCSPLLPLRENPSKWERFSTKRSGTYCESSVCGTRQNATSGQWVLPDQICSGYNVNVHTGTCQELGMPVGGAGFGTQLKDATPITVSSTSVILQSFGRCNCTLAKVGGRWTLFIGQWCQIPVQGCTDPNAVTQVGLLPCHGHGDCVPRPGATNIPGLLNEIEPRHRCMCHDDFRGTYCQDDQATCEPSCKPGYGTCLFIQRTRSALSAAATGVCECNSDFLWTPEKANPGLPLGCSRDWCNDTGGMTTLYEAGCLCPDSREITRIVDTSKRYAPHLGYFMGCRTLCPFWNEIECGAVRSHLLPPRLLSDEYSFCSSAINVTSIQKYDQRNPKCTCAATDWGWDPIDQSDMKVEWVNGICKPVCGNGAKWKSTGPGSRGLCECINPGPRPTGLKPGSSEEIKYNQDRQRWLLCGPFDKPDFYQSFCKNGGSWSDGKCTCMGRFYGDTCQKEDCSPGIYTPQFSTSVCNCSYPWKTQLDRFLPYFGKCISACVHGLPNAQPKNCKCAVGYTGRFCDINVCAPYGQVRTQNPTPQNPCVCITPVLGGRFCNTSMCGTHGSLVKAVDQPPSCRCINNRYWSGTLCDQDLCGVPGDDILTTGYWSDDRKDASGKPIAPGCVCYPGYDHLNASFGVCARRLCGARGFVQFCQTCKPQYKCRCDGPDQHSRPGDPSSSCDAKPCLHGAPVFGVNRTTVVCVCDPGYYGSACQFSKCGESQRVEYDANTQSCRCVYPYKNSKCEQTWCGAGVIVTQPVIQISLPGNPLRFECQCDSRRGFVLIEPVPPLDISILLTPRCQLGCIANHTQSIVEDKCVCRPGFAGIWCQDMVCPPPPQPTVSLDDYYEKTPVLIGSIIIGVFLILVAIVVPVLVYVHFKRQQQQTNGRAMTSETRPLLSPVSNTTPTARRSTVSKSPV